MSSKNRETFPAFLLNKNLNIYLREAKQCFWVQLHKCTIRREALGLTQKEKYY